MLFIPTVFLCIESLRFPRDLSADFGAFETFEYLATLRILLNFSDTLDSKVLKFRTFRILSRRLLEHFGILLGSFRNRELFRTNLSLKASRSVFITPKAVVNLLHSNRSVSVLSLDRCLDQCSASLPGRSFWPIASGRFERTTSYLRKFFGHRFLNPGCTGAYSGERNAARPTGPLSKWSAHTLGQH